MLKGCDIAIVEQLITSGISTSASPGFVYSRSGNATPGTWLSNNSVPSNITGIPFGLDNGKVVQIWAASQNIDSYTIEVYHHLGDETSLTFLTSVNVVSVRQDFFGITDFGSVPIPKNVQMAVKLVGGAAKNPKVALFLGGA